MENMKEDDDLPQIHALCANCESKGRMSRTSYFCSDECAKTYVRSCKFCRSKPAKKFCSETCRQLHLIRVGTDPNLRPVCSKFLQKKCPFPKKKCWSRHPTIVRRSGNVVLQFEKTFTSRLTRYLQSARYRKELRIESEAIGFQEGLITKSQASSRFLFLSVEDVRSTLERLRDDIVLSRVIQKCFVVSTDGTFGDIQSVRTFATDSRRTIVNVRSFPKALENELSDIVSSPSKEGSSPCDDDHTLFVVRIHDTFHVGVDLVSNVPCIRISSEKDPAAVSRAFFKLREVLSRSSVIQWTSQVASSGESEVKYHDVCAMDVGASPGGWSYLLASRGCKCVHAVDPAAMASPIPSNVTHHREKIEVLVSRHGIKSDSIHLYVCDMNANPRHMMRVFDSATPLLVDGAAVVLTFKSFADAKTSKGKRKRAFDTVVDDDEHNEAALDLLRRPMQETMRTSLLVLRRDFAYDGTVRAFHLMSNGQQERTVVFRYKKKK